MAENNKVLSVHIMRSRSNRKDIDAKYALAASNYIKELIKMDNKEKILKKIDETKQYIEELQKNIKNLEKQLNNETNKWKPGYEDLFYYITDTGTIGKEIFTNHQYDIAKIEMGNCFKTKKEALFELEKIKVRAELKKFSFEPNWNDTHTQKYYIYYDNDSKRLSVDCLGFLQDDIIYFDSLDTVEEAIKTVGEDRIKKYLFGKE